MTTIYLIRHAEAEGNLYRIAQGQYNSILTDRGWRQVQALERRFADIPIHAAYSSDLYRTCATASAIVKPKGLTLHKRADLREICVGQWEQRTWGDIYREQPAEVENFKCHMDRWYIDGAETPAQVRDRLLNALREIAVENEGRTVAVFSHGYAIRLTLAALQGCTLAQTGTTPHGDNTAVALLEAENGVLHVRYRDDNSHLQTPEYLAGESRRKRATSLEGGVRFAPISQQDLAALKAAEHWEDLPSLPEKEGQRVLAAYLREMAIGLVSFCPHDGELTLLYLCPAYRCQGYGIQAVGQAVQAVRAEGGETLFVARPLSPQARRFFTYYGFAPTGTTPEGTERLEKDIGFRGIF